MLKLISLSIIFLSFSFITLAENTEFELLLLNDKELDLTPGTTSNIVIKLVNNTDFNQEFFLETNCPKGINFLSDFTSIGLDKSSEINKILSFYTSNSIKAGKYFISIDAFEKFQNKKIGTISFSVIVKPRYDILLEVFKASDYALSGDTLDIKFMVQNLSNTEASISTIIGIAGKSESKTYKLLPDSFVFEHYTAITEKNIIYNTRKSISITASIAENPEISKTQYHFVELIPTGRYKFDPYNRFPIKVSGIYASNIGKGKTESAQMFDISGSSELNSITNGRLDFHFTGPDRMGKPILGVYDEYYLSYSTPKLKITVGDNSYRLSFLTENARYGRGAEYKRVFKKICVGSFINYPRFYPQIKRVFSIYSGFLSEDKFQLTAGYLNKEMSSKKVAHLYTISGTAYPFKWLDLSLEYATALLENSVTKAYKTEVKLNYPKISTFFNYTMADKNFSGYFSNSEYLSTGIFGTLTKKINVTANYSFNFYNIAMDTIYTNAPFSKNLTFATNYRLSSNNNVNVSLINSERKDRMLPRKFHFEENSLRLTFIKDFKKIKVNLGGDIGKVNNLINSDTGQLANIYKTYLSLNYLINKSVFLNSFVNYMGNQGYLTGSFNKFYYGGSFHAKMYKNLILILNYQNNYSIEEYYRDRSLFDVKASLSFNDKHDLEIIGTYNIVRNSLEQKNTRVMLKYTYTINAPVSIKKDVGSLKGRLINKGVDNTEGVIFTLDGNRTVSDKNGLFSFNNIKAGTYFLLMDDSKTGLFAITEVPGPYKIEIKPGEENFLEIVFTKSCRIMGQIVIEEESNFDKKDYVPVKEELTGLIIEASSEKEMFRLISNSEGKFCFEDLRPGKWKVKIYSNGIPSGYELLNEFFYLDLTAGFEERISVKVKKKVRKINFVKLSDKV